MTTLGILVAGGHGTRLHATTPKAMAMCSGQTLLDRATSTLAALCDQFVVVAPATMALPVPATRRVFDMPGSEGPLGALIAGARSRLFEEALVLAVDMPLLTPATLGALRELRGDSAAVLPAPGGIPQPLAAWYTARAFESLVASLAAGERSVTRAVLALSPRLLDDAALAKLPGGVRAWMNVNTAAELSEAERLLEAGWLA